MKLKTLVIDLGKKKHNIYKITPGISKRYLGGRGLSTWILHERLGDSNPPTAPLIISPGFLSGMAVFSSRTAITSISPLTGGLASSIFGGSFGINLKKAGYDALMLLGKYKTDKALVIIDNDKVKILRADHLKNKTVYEATSILKKDLGKEYSILTVGPSAENQVAFANAIADYGHVAGRTGIGAVLGSKNVKAISVCGTEDAFNKRDLKVDVKKLSKLNSSCQHKILDNKYGCKPDGTLLLIEKLSIVRKMPAQYWGEVLDCDTAHALYSEIEKRVHSKLTCKSCPVSCKNNLRCGEGIVYGAEYEGVAMLGPQLNLYDVEEILRLYLLANEMGMDVISLAHVLSLLKKKYPKLVDNFEKIKDVICSIAFRKGIGNELADGEKHIATAFGLRDYLVASKRLGWEATYPHNSAACFIGHATSTRGDHMRGLPLLELFLSPESIDWLLKKLKIKETLVQLYGNKLEKYERQYAKEYKNTLTLLILSEDYKALIDSLGLCLFVSKFDIGISFSEMIKYLRACNLNYNKARLLNTGREVVYLENTFNSKRGLRIKAEEDLPRRLCGQRLLNEYKDLITAYVNIRDLEQT